MRIKHLFVLVNIRNKGEFGTVNHVLSCAKYRLHLKRKNIITLIYIYKFIIFSVICVILTDYQHQVTYQRNKMSYEQE